MTEETRELVEALTKGFSDIVTDLKSEMKTLVKREELVELIKSIGKKMDEQNATLLDVLNRYERFTEKHEQTFQNIKKSID